MAYIRTDHRPCTANLANEVQLTPRVTDKRQRSGFAIWPGVRKFLKQLTAKSEPKPKIQEGFLAETWKRGGDYSSSGALRALMGMKDNIVCDGLSESQRSRLRHNLTEHGEVLAAINAVLRDVEHSDMPGGEFRNFLVYLQTSLNQVYDAVGCKQGTELRGNERKFEQLKNVLMDAWMLGDQSASPAERIEEQLKQLEGDPSQFMVSEKPGRLAKSPDTIRKLQAELQREGTVARHDAEELIRWAMKGSSEKFPKLPFNTYVGNFMSSSVEARNDFLKSMLKAVATEAAPSRWDPLDASQHFNAALQEIAVARPFSLDALAGSLETSKDAVWPSLDIALQYERSANKAQTMLEFEEKLAPKEKFRIYLNLVGQSRQSDVINKVVEDFRHWAKAVDVRNPWAYHADEGVEPPAEPALSGARQPFVFPKLDDITDPKSADEALAKIVEFVGHLDDTEVKGAVLEGLRQSGTSKDTTRALISYATLDEVTPRTVRVYGAITSFDLEEG